MRGIAEFLVLSPSSPSVGTFPVRLVIPFQMQAQDTWKVAQTCNTLCSVIATRQAATLSVTELTIVVQLAVIVLGWSWYPCTVHSAGVVHIGGLQIWC